MPPGTRGFVELDGNYHAFNVPSGHLGAAHGKREDDTIGAGINDQGSIVGSDFSTRDGGQADLGGFLFSK